MRARRLETEAPGYQVVGPRRMAPYPGIQRTANGVMCAGGERPMPRSTPARSAASAALRCDGMIEDGLIRSTPYGAHDAALVVENVCKSFPASYGLRSWLYNRGRIPRIEVLRGVDLTVRRGELLGLLGPNGAGKTTLLKALATLLLPDSGRIVVEGIDTKADPIAAKRKIGLCISEERSFYYRLTARDNLAFFGAMYGLRGSALYRRIEEVAELVDLVDVLDRRFAGFSSGMRQRLTVARALLGDPEIVLLDEPTRAIDPVHAEELRSFIRTELIDRLGKTVVLATNLLEEAWHLCDRVAVVKGGTIVALGPPATLDAGVHAVARYTIRLERSDAALDARIEAIPGVRLVDVVPDGRAVAMHVDICGNPEALSALCRALGAADVRVRGFSEVEARPVDIFQRVTRGHA